MNLTRKLFIVPILVGLAGVLILQHLLADNYQALGIVKYTLNSMIFAVSLLLPKPTREHRILAWAFRFIYAADFFFVFLGAMPGLSPEFLWIKLGGLSVFTLGYFCFIYLSTRGAKWNSREILLAVPILAIAVPIGTFCFHFMRPNQTVFFFMFVPFVTIVGICGLSALARSYYRIEIRKLFALSGSLFFISEMGFAIGSFYPGLTRNTPWVGNEIWLTYIPALIILLAILSIPEWKEEHSASINQ